MREILFRGKAINRRADMSYCSNYKDGDWVYGLVTKPFDKRFPKLPAEMRNTDGISRIEVDYRTVGQYTGLTDKNGNKIFEGDIVELTYYTLPEERKVMAEVAYEEESAAFVLYSFGTKNKGICVEICNTNKVIGNIHDNPELMEVKK